MPTSQATQSQAEQFLASQGIKFRVVQSKRGPGEWNVTFSRHGGGRLKLDFEQSQEPTLQEVVTDMILAQPPLSDYGADGKRFYSIDDRMEYARLRDFFGNDGMVELRAIQKAMVTG
jgi:hypothetical protein